MAQTSPGLRKGDLVQVKSYDEILQTLDADGTLNQLPFMPEMMQHCGKRLRVTHRVFKTCTSGSRNSSNMRGFKTDDVVMLEGVRCPGSEHDGCQKFCNILWRETWLQKIDDQTATEPASLTPNGAERLRARLKTKVSPEKYFCQASEILNFTYPISKKERFAKCSDDLNAGNASLIQMIGRISIWTFWKAWKNVFGPFARGKCTTTTPSKTLDLHTGERVIVEPLTKIRETLNEKANNRGLWFSPDMRLECGHEKVVERHLEKIIVDGTGEMRAMKNTVYLKDSYCSCPHVAFGGCPRGEFIYWREIWLRRAQESK